MVLHARSFQEIIKRERIADPALLPVSVCATAGSSLGSSLGSRSYIGSASSEWSLERSLKSALSEIQADPAMAMAPLQATICSRPSSAWRHGDRHGDHEPPLDRQACVRVCCMEEHAEHGENEGPMNHDFLEMNVIGTRQRWSAATTSVCVGSGAWMSLDPAAATAAPLRDKVALLQWEGVEDTVAWAEQAPSPLQSRSVLLPGSTRHAPHALLHTPCSTRPAPHARFHTWTSLAWALRSPD